ncbi:MAG: alpha/beta hydrolase [Bacteroidetes bacterium]|nr:alpha/beta hydrolase [Bacteroidota bacterium]
MIVERNSDSDSAEHLSVMMDGEPVVVRLSVSGPEDGAPLLVMHGWGSSTLLMRPMIDRLSDTFRVAAFDFPGHGESPVPKKGYGMAGHLDIVHGVLAHLGWSSYAIAGHSNGGRVALAHAAKSSDDIQFLALIAPSGIRRHRSLSYYIRSWSARILKAPFVLLPGPLQALGLDWLRHSLVWKLLGSSDYRSLHGVMRETFVQTVNHYVDNVLPDVKASVLLLRGERDEAITNEQIERMNYLLPNAGAYEVPGAGHYAHIDRPDVVATAIRSLHTG